MAIYSEADQLSLPIANAAPEPYIADSIGTELVTRCAALRRDLVTEMSTAQLLAKLLGSATAALCEQLVTAFPNLRQLAALNPGVLFDHGFTGAQVSRLEAIFEIMKRHGEIEWPIGAVFRSSGDIYLHFRERLATEAVEFFYAVLLDNHHQKIRDVMVSKGSLTASLVHPRDIFGQVVRYGAAAVVFVHNHPSGDPTPSREDLEITRRLREVGQLIGVRIVDHIVIGRGRYVSFVDDGYW